MTTFETTIQTYLETAQRLIRSLPRPTRKQTRVSRNVVITFTPRHGNWPKVPTRLVSMMRQSTGGLSTTYDEDDIKVDGVESRVEVATPEPASVEQPKPQPKPVQKRRRGEDNSLQLSLFGEL